MDWVAMGTRQGRVYRGLTVEQRMLLDRAVGAADGLRDRVREVNRLARLGGDPQDAAAVRGRLFEMDATTSAGNG